ncbi:MAG: acyltransferase family protein [Solirubrobacterales bacterium]
MPEPIKSSQRYMPGLDGLRAIAVLGVIVYHLGFGWAPGGLLGVGVFFTLSGYLITDILLNQVNHGGIKLGRFWLARARRLLPALFLMLVVVLAWVTVFGPHQPLDFRGAVLSAVAYVNNWWLIFHDISYFAQYAKPEPLNHLWSLSVEEQFYLVWPFLVMLGVKVVHELPGSHGLRPRLGAVIMGLALLSGILMLVLYSPGVDPSRVYYGTDTRALELLVGAALATVWPSRKLKKAIAPGARRVIDATGLVGLLVIFLMFWKSQEYSPFLYRGGFLLLSVATAAAVAAMAHPATRLGPIVGCRPMLWIGQRSYGIYLWHFPIIILTTPDGVQQGVDLPRAFLQVAATFGIAALSWRFVEDPIRHGALRRWWAQARDPRWRRSLDRTARIGFAAAAVVMAAALAGIAGFNAGPPRDTGAPGDITVATTSTTGDPSGASDAADPSTTSCDSVVHIGDSTSVGMVSAEYLPSEDDRIAVQYGRVGATTQHLEVAVARSIYETSDGVANAQDVAQSWKAQGFDGCWVFALGTNDAVSVAAGSEMTAADRIGAMMDIAHGEPVLWVNLKSLVPSGPTSSANMESWDRSLLTACNRYPNMRVYDWASQARDEWYAEDGVHFTAEGNAERAADVAAALLAAFPAGSEVDRSEGESCLIGPDQVAEAQKEVRRRERSERQSKRKSGSGGSISASVSG